MQRDVIDIMAIIIIALCKSITYFTTDYLQNETKSSSRKAVMSCLPSLLMAKVHYHQSFSCSKLNTNTSDRLPALTSESLNHKQKKVLTSKCRSWSITA